MLPATFSAERVAPTRVGGVRAGLPSATQQQAAREELQERIRSMQAVRLDERTLPLLPALQQALPGGLRQGTAYSVIGSSTVALALLAAPSAQGAWCGALGLPDLGTEAAARMGINLERLVLVPEPGRHWLTVAAAMTDVLAVVVAHPLARVGAAEASRLAARLRQSGATLIATGPWPGAETTITVTGNSWQGLGAGHGYLSDRQVLVEVTGRQQRPRRARVDLPAGPGLTVAPDPAFSQLPGRPLALLGRSEVAG